MCIVSLLAETVVRGVINGQERWVVEKSPYILTNDLLISKDGRLVIEPGVEVLVEQPTYVPASIQQINGVDSFGVTIKVEGALYCVGQSHNPIVMRGRYIKESYTHWCGIELNSSRSDEIVIGYTNIANATAGITVKKGMPLLRNLVLEFNNIGVLSLGLSTPRIIQSIFTANFLAAVRIKESNPELYNNIVYENRNVGIWGDRVSDFIFEHNLVYDNGDRDYVACPVGLGVNKKKNRNGDSVDVYQNLSVNPLFVGSKAVETLLHKEAKDRAEQTFDGVVEVEYLDSSSAKYELYKDSPCINAGKAMGDKFKEADGSHADLGVLGGPAFIEFR